MRFRSPLIVPTEAVYTFAGSERVFRIADSKALETRIQTGRRVGSLVEVLSGLEEGATVAVGAPDLRNGQAVSIRSSQVTQR